MIALGCDHGGYNLKEAIKKHFDENHIEYIDFGTHSTGSVDYVPIAQSVALQVACGKCKFGILCCGTGIGMSIAANKIRGIRAAVCDSESLASVTRQHNDANILCLGGRVISEDLATKLCDIFISTEFDGGRHKRRIDQITSLEQECKNMEECRNDR